MCTVKPVVSSQYRQGKMTFECNWLHNAGYFTVEIRKYGHLNAGGCLMRRNTNTSLTVSPWAIYNTCLLKLINVRLQLKVLWNHDGLLKREK